MAELVRLEIDGAVGIIRLDRPPVNAINRAIHRDLLAVTEQRGGQPGHSRGRALRRRTCFRRRRRHQGNGRRDVPRDRRADRHSQCRSQLGQQAYPAGDRRHHRLRAGRRIRAGAGRRFPVHRRERHHRAAGNHSGGHSRGGWHPTAGPVDRADQGQGADLHRPAGHSGRGRCAGAGQQGGTRRSGLSGRRWRWPPGWPPVRPRRWRRRSGPSTTDWTARWPPVWNWRPRKFAELFGTEDARTGMTFVHRAGTGKGHVRRSLTGPARHGLPVQRR